MVYFLAAGRDWHTWVQDDGGGSGCFIISKEVASLGLTTIFALKLQLILERQGHDSNVAIETVVSWVEDFYLQRDVTCEGLHSASVYAVHVAQL